MKVNLFPDRRGMTSNTQNNSPNPKPLKEDPDGLTIQIEESAEKLERYSVSSVKGGKDEAESNDETEEESSVENDTRNPESKSKRAPRPMRYIERIHKMITSLSSSKPHIAQWCDVEGELSFIAATKCKGDKKKRKSIDDDNESRDSTEEDRLKELEENQGLYEYPISFVIRNKNRFGELLHTFGFDTSNFSSFERQLNNYNFQKVHYHSPGTKATQAQGTTVHPHGGEGQCIAFHHPCFNRSATCDQLSKIVPKRRGIQYSQAHKAAQAAAALKEAQAAAATIVQAITDEGSKDSEKTRNERRNPKVTSGSSDFLKDRLEELEEDNSRLHRQVDRMERRVAYLEQDMRLMMDYCELMMARDRRSTVGIYGGPHPEGLFRSHAHVGHAAAERGAFVDMRLHAAGGLPTAHAIPGTFVSRVGPYPPPGLHEQGLAGVPPPQASRYHSDNTRLVNMLEEIASKRRRLDSPLGNDDSSVDRRRPTSQDRHTSASK